MLPWREATVEEAATLVQPIDCPAALLAATYIPGDQFSVAPILVVTDRHVYSYYDTFGIWSSHTWLACRRKSCLYLRRSDTACNHGAILFRLERIGAGSRGHRPQGSSPDKTPHDQRCGGLLERSTMEREITLPWIAPTFNRGRAKPRPELTMSYCVRTHPSSGLQHGGRDLADALKRHCFAAGQVSHSRGEVRSATRLHNPR